MRGKKKRKKKKKEEKKKRRRRKVGTIVCCFKFLRHVLICLRGWSQQQGREREKGWGNRDEQKNNKKERKDRAPAANLHLEFESTTKN